MLNRVRAAHPALRWLRNLRFHHVEDENFLVFSKSRIVDGTRDTVVVVANLDPHGTRNTLVRLDMPALGLDWSTHMPVHDVVTDQVWHWKEANYVRLGPDFEPVHILEVGSY